MAQLQQSLLLLMFEHDDPKGLASYQIESIDICMMPIDDA
jgi:hypothetical protein